MLTLSFDPDNQEDVDRARSIFDVVSARVRPGALVAEGTDLSAEIANDLLGRVGARGRELVILAAGFERPFSLYDLAEKLGDSPAVNPGAISRMKSRWANLGRSIAATRARFGNIEIFTEQIPVPDGDGYFTFVMHDGIRKAVLKKKKE